MKALNILLSFLILSIMAQHAEAQTFVKISTSMGDMKVKLYDETPMHRDNFIKLAKEGYYNELLFHRVIAGFMIQGGDPQSRTAKPGQRLGTGGPSYTVPAEFAPAFIHKKGALAAARQGDNVNPMKASSGSQFYIVQGKVYTDAELNMLETRTGTRFTDAQRAAYKSVGGTPFLDYQYTVFGEIVEGLDVIDKLGAVATDAADRPQKDVKFSVSIVK